jgi:hypothetical protein
MRKFILLFIVILGMTGCAVSTRYVRYTDQQFLPKAKYYLISIYLESQTPPLAQPYRVIGRIETEGRTSEGVNSDTLADEAKRIARAKGGDAIINARTEAATYSGTDVIPGQCGHRHCYPTEYVSHVDTSLRFRGELIVFTPAGIQKNK